MGAPGAVGAGLDDDFCGVCIGDPADGGAAVLDLCGDAGGVWRAFAEPGHGWDGGGLGVGAGELGGDAALVFDEGFDAPVDVAVPVAADFSC